MTPRATWRLVILALLATGCADTGRRGDAETAAFVDAACTTPVVMGYVLAGSARASTVTRDGDLIDTIGVDGVALTGRAGVTAVSAEATALRRAARAAGRPPVLLLSNYNDRLGDFDEPRAHRMLVSAARRNRTARALARRAAGFSGVQIDLESLRRRDTRGLVAFTRAVRRALSGTKAVSMAFMASSSVRGYAARGYDLRTLARLLDVAALMTYDEHGPWSGPGPIAAMPWVRASLRSFVTRVPRDKVDLGAAAYGYRWGGGAPELTVPQARRLAGSRATWSPTYGEWHATLPHGRRLWWDDARSVDLRRRVAVAQHLHGLAIWQLGSSGRLQP